MKSTVGVLAILLGIFIGTSPPAFGERYVGGQLGLVKPDDLKNVEGIGSAKGIESSDLDLKNVMGYGAKVGYFFLKILTGLE